MVLSVDEVKTHLRIEENDEDSYIAGLIAQAQAAAEDFCRVSFEPEAAESGDAPSPPEPVRLAVLLMVSHYYENRDNPDRAVYGTMRIAFENLLYPYRDPDKMF
ncbi:MAG: head-tail connector protein [Clostridiales bacterium]|nr:head-tail connector protein [Clostridiales bacterium]